MPRQPGQTWYDALWVKLRNRHYMLLPCYVHSRDPFNRIRRIFCLMTILELHVLWMAMLLLVSHTTLKLTKTMRRSTLTVGLIIICVITTIPISKALCTLFQASAKSRPVDFRTGKPLPLPPESHRRVGHLKCHGNAAAAHGNSRSGFSIGSGVVEAAAPTGREPEVEDAGRAFGFGDEMQSARSPSQSPRRRQLAVATQQMLDAELSGLDVKPAADSAATTAETELDNLLDTVPNQHGQTAAGRTQQEGEKKNNAATSAAMERLEAGDTNEHERSGLEQQQLSGTSTQQSQPIHAADSEVQNLRGQHEQHQQDERAHGSLEDRLRGGSLKLGGNARRSQAVRDSVAFYGHFVTIFLCIFCLFALFMLYLYAAKLSQADLMWYWLQCAVVSVAIDAVLIQPAKIGLNSRKSLKLGRRQRNAVVSTGRSSTRATNAGTASISKSRCWKSVKYKHIWLLPLFREPKNHPFNRWRRFVCLLFCFGVIVMMTSAFLLVVVTDPSTLQFGSLCLTAALAALLMFPISKVVVDVSFGSKEDVDTVLEFGRTTTPLIRSPAARWAHWFMLCGICYCGAVSWHNAQNMIKHGLVGSWVTTCGMTIGFDACILQPVRGWISSQKQKRSDAALEFDWI